MIMGARFVSLLLLSLRFETHFSYLLHSLGAIVKGDQVSASNVEAVEVLDCLFGVKNVLVHNEGSALFVSVFSLPYLLDRSEPPEHIVHLLSGNLVREIPHKDDFVDLRGQPDGFFVTAVHSSHDSLIKL